MFLLLSLFVGGGVGAQGSDSKVATIGEARALNERTAELFKAQKYAEALPLAQRASAICEQKLGPEHPETAASLNQEAQIYRGLLQYRQAEPLLVRALAIREKTLGPEHPETAESLHNLAGVYVESGAYAKAEPLYLRALAIREKTLGSESLVTATTLHALGQFYRRTGAFAQAEAAHQRGLAIREKVGGPDNLEVATSLVNLGTVYWNMGEYAKAEAAYRRAAAIREKVLGPDHPDTGIAVGNLAMLYHVNGAYDKAEPLYLRALAVEEKNLGPEHIEVANTLNNLAALYDSTGAYAKSEPLYQRSLAIREKVLGPDHDDVAQSLNNLGALYRGIGANEKAEPLYRRALAIREKTLGSDHPDLAQSLHNLANLYVETGAYAQAESFYQRALAIKEKSLGPEHPDLAHSLDKIAELYRVMGEYVKAESFGKRALAIMEKAVGPDHPDTARFVVELARLYWVMGDSKQAVQLLERAQISQDRNSARFLLSGSEARKRAYVDSLVENSYRDVSFSLSVPGRDSVMLGLTSVLHYKGRVLDTMANSSARLRKSVQPQDRAVFEQLADIANQLSTLTYRGPGELSSDEYRRQLDELTRRQEVLEADLSKRSAEFRQQIAPATVATVAAAIPKDAVLVEWFRYVPFNPKQVGDVALKDNPRYMAYVLKRSGNPVAIDIGDAGEIESLLRAFRDAAGDSRRSDVKLSAAALSEKLLRPLRGQLSGYERILMSPDGALNLLPMAALVDEHGDYLAQHYEITYLTSGRDLLRFGPRAVAHGEAVVMADPNFGTNTRVAQAESANSSLRSLEFDRGGLIFRPLTNTALEAQALKSMMKLKDSEVFLQANATEANLKQLHGPRILHIATHGFFLNDRELETETKQRAAKDFSPSVVENPLLRSGLALSGANARQSTANDDGILTALEAAQLDLNGTELVVLSACDSGFGEIKNGEGVYGLRRALVLAGAQSQVTTLWKVSDEATLKLMVEYYRRLLSGAGRSAALRQAQQTMLANAALSHPYYWASFVPIGAWTSLPAAH